MAAGSLLIKEAGGYVSDFNGEDKFLENGNVIAAPRKVYAQLQALMAT
jgi:myo-inositol-1(or 4)-monophosphatase